VEPFAQTVGLVTLAAYVYLVLPFLLSVLLVGYLVLRMRDNRSEDHDPQLGLKAGLHFFFSLSILLLLSGLTVVVVDALTAEKAAPGSDWRQAQRTGWALVVAGGLLSLLHFACLQAATNDRRWPAARRLFLGWRFAMHGLVVVAALTALVVVLFQKDFGDKDARKGLFGVLFVWLPSWVLHLALLCLYSGEPSRLQPLEIPRNPFSSRRE